MCDCPSGSFAVWPYPILCLQCPSPQAIRSQRPATQGSCSHVEDAVPTDIAGRTAAAGGTAGNANGDPSVPADGSPASLATGHAPFPPSLPRRRGGEIVPRLTRAFKRSGYRFASRKCDETKISSSLSDSTESESALAAPLALRLLNVDESSAASRRLRLGMCERFDRLQTRDC
jgi:hypothetical protein